MDEIWPRYLARLRQEGGDARQWSVDAGAIVQGHLDTIANALDRKLVLWLALVDGSECVAVEVEATTVLRTALTHFVSRAADLMLASRDVTDGICVELNHRPSGDQYEVVTWGAFRLPSE